MPRAYLGPALFALLTSSLSAQAPGDAAPPAVAQRLMRLQHEYARLTVARDTTALRRIEPPDATFHYPDGSTGTGVTDLASVASGDVTIKSWTIDSMRVRLLSPAVAVVTGHASIQQGQMKSPSGGAALDLSGQYRTIDVWRQRKGQWQIAAEQYTRIAEQ